MKYFRGKGRRYGRRLRRGRGAVKFWKKSVPRPIRKYVKAIVHRNIENKMRYNYASNQPIETGSPTTMTWPLLPAIDLGTGTGNRIGNIIKPVKGVWKCVVNLLPYSTTTNSAAQPTWVKIWIVRDLRASGQLATMDSTSFNAFFNGNNTTLGFQNNCLDTVLDVNTDNFRVLTTRMFKLGLANHISGPTNPSSYFDNSPASKIITIDYSKYVKKALKFQDGSTYAINENLYFVIQAVPCDGTGASSQQKIEMHYTNRFYYEDA